MKNKDRMSFYWERCKSQYIQLRRGSQKRRGNGHNGPEWLSKNEKDIIKGHDEPGNEKTSRNTVCSGNAISLCDSMTETAVFLVVMQQIDEQEVNKE